MNKFDISEKRLLTIISNLEKRINNKILLFFIRIIKTIIFAIKGFINDNCQKSASAMTYYTLLSIVPVLAMFFGIAKGFGFEQTLEAELIKRFADQQALLEQLLSFTHSMLDNAKGGVIAGIGLVFLFWSVMNLLSRIEEEFNEIWTVRKDKVLWRKFSEYLTIMLIAPILLIMSSSLNAFLSTHIADVVNNINLLGYFSPAIFIGLKLIPYLIVWLLFSVLYILMPNTNVNISSGIFAGILAGTIFHIVQSWYFVIQYNLSSYNAIYGSFAALPLLLIWLQLSWIIILFGSEISYTFQNFNSFMLNVQSKDISNYNVKIIALHLMSEITKRHENKSDATSLDELSDKYALPDSLIKIVTDKLCDAGIITKIKENNKISFLPSFDINKIYISTVLDSIDKNKENIFVEEDKVTLKMNAIEEHIKKSDYNILVKDL